MSLNKNLCQHEWCFACYYQTAGTFKPNHVVILFCKKCAKIKQEQVEEKRK